MKNPFSRRTDSPQVYYTVNDRFDLVMFLSVLILLAMGFLAIYSSTQNTVIEKGNFLKQTIAVVLSLSVFAVIYNLPTQIISKASLPLYIFSLVLLVAVLLFGRKVGGAKAWLYFGTFSFQPAEFAKMATVIFLARYLSRNQTQIDSLKDIIITLSIGGVPVLLILMEPDLGSSLVFAGMMITMVFWKGISLFGLFLVLSPVLVMGAALFGGFYFFLALLVVIAGLIYFKRDLFFSGSIFAVNIAVGFFVDIVYEFLSPHQQKRIASFLDPASDPLGSGYNSIQAKIAIGSGGLFGKGFLSGNQTQLQFIPEQWTDFIFCVIGEEFGFAGSLAILILYMILFTRILRIANMSKYQFHSLIAVGVLSIFFTHFVINVGMAIGIIPVIGIPLPFISYGGSSLLINMTMLGIIFNIYRTRKNYS
ncbi:MAG: rod shape-determining protein RodA [Ignavibacteriales bacterium]|nr:Peptidoglycan glycosyltransferase MrdB [Ignavibacteriaceae bacterium]MCK6612942.1 rod shape-determining protein RodA [Ignavibacteriaceae bacterium]QOJ29345.1 MAG: rod shape-determining protein RodA [Ignavibacteriales bacterium]